MPITLNILPLPLPIFYLEPPNLLTPLLLFYFIAVPLLNNVGDGVIKVTLVIKVCRFCKQILSMRFASSVLQHFDVQNLYIHNPITYVIQLNLVANISDLGKGPCRVKR